MYVKTKNSEHIVPLFPFIHRKNIRRSKYFYLKLINQFDEFLPAEGAHAKADFPHDDTATQAALGLVVGQWHVFMIEKHPYISECWFEVYG
ncbi:hypothetical protein [Xenorhabdus sp. PB62.4]|uniref:hypothetical protein n=1 Tax=Xenorhabdus sp. PB62.4 TaxID=1851573 RepID=UPI0016569760|nr:hypothetical protein [Xenorhabdus sp. PB62.4]